MVTENGEFQWSSRQGERETARSRKVPPHLRLDPLRIHPPNPRPSTAAGAPRALSPLLPPVPHSPRNAYAYARPDDPFLHPASSQVGRTDEYALRKPTYSSPTFPRSPSPNLPLPEDDFQRPSYRRGPPPGRPGLRISMSTSRMYSRRPRGQPSRERYPNESPSRGLALPRYTPNGSSDVYADEALRSSVNSAMTSRSSIEQASGTERSSVLTKSSSITDLSPDTPDGLDEKDGGMSVEDAISMYLDGFSDVTEEPASPGFGDDSKMRPISPRPPTELTYNTGHSSDENSPDLLPSDGLPPVPAIPDLASVDRKLQDEQFLRETNDEETPVEPSNQKETQEAPAANRSETKVLLSGVVPPPLGLGTEHRDRYGFRKKTHYITLEQYEAWNGPYSEFVAIRRVKWAELLKENGLPTSEPTAFPAKSSKMKRFIRKGIPAEFRGAAWFWYAGGFDLLNRHPGLYDRLVKEAMDSPNNDDKEHIERDLHRTFPDNLHFKPEFVDEAMNSGTSSGSSNPKYSSVTVETQMIQSLRRVLYAFSLHNPKVGYTQSLNFITGMLLLFLPEEKAFWMLHIMTSVYLPGTHEISLEGANIDLWILMVLLKESLPHIYNKIAGNTGRSKTPALTVDSRLPDITLGLTNWLMSLFIGSLPLETTLRVWDVFFFEGSKTFFRVSLAIFKACEKDILAVSDPMEVFQVVQTVPKKLLDANALLEDCFVRRHRVGQGRIEELRASRRAAVRQEKLRRSLAISKGQLQAATDEWPTTRSRTPIPGFERKVADSWRHMRQHAFK
ncbi:hypothetical protein CDV55_102571 [Aspergillus turcosus]|uniref:Rab-GAP TBC domain-containing protein n=1 Tax=Aspergillus turcosus TaxID=1245748 RepID=A0A229X1V0_9EURO|nr:hypothetical protein CDV55_102571 [Aspergillus turcosus]RLL94501.1 hypothetical protein CFD26_102815 [Aspergillus turcosus]